MPTSTTSYRPQDWARINEVRQRRTLQEQQLDARVFECAHNFRDHPCANGIEMRVLHPSRGEPRAGGWRNCNTRVEEMRAEQRLHPVLFSGLQHLLPVVKRFDRLA